MKHLLALSIGPVQDFIAAARRTSDLTAGSDLLVEIAKAVATAVEEHAGHDSLIFPAGTEIDAPNKILAALPEGMSPRIVAEAAKLAARTALSNAWTAANANIGGYDINQPLAVDQIGRFLEFYAAWIDFTDGTYAERREQVDALLAARKALRDFAPSGSEAASTHIPAKSPLDPAFECVFDRMPDIPDGEKGEPGFLRLRRTEFLDAVSVIKRVRGRGYGHIPSTRWFVRKQRDPDCSIMTDWDDDDEKPEPYSYFAILVADGDRMGKLLSQMKSPNEHRDFSRKLAEFAQRTRAIVDEHEGFRIYAGGDDVLAFLPVRTAIDCAMHLAREFTNVRQGDACTTLSAGVAVVHYRQPLSMSLLQARAAESAAKREGRDALCLAIHTRGGQPLYVTQKWDQWGPRASTMSTTSTTSFDTWTRAFTDGVLTRGVAYELKELAREFANANVSNDLLLKEAERIWDRKQSENKSRKVDFPPESGASVEALRLFADQLVAARFLTSKGD